MEALFEIEALRPYLPIVTMLRDAWEQSGGNWLFFLPFIPLGLVQTYKLDVVQGIVSARWPLFAFSSLPLGAQMVLSFLIGSLPVLGGKLVLGAGLGTAVVVAAGAGIAAVLGFKPFKATHTAVGAKVYSALPPAASRAISIIAPLDLTRVEEERVARAAKAAKK